MGGGRRGFVLAVVSFALVVLSAVAAGAFFAAVWAIRSGGRRLDDVRARLLAETAGAGAVASWLDAKLDTVAVGSARTWTAAAGPGEVTLAVSRTGIGAASVVALARAGAIERRVGWWLAPQLPFRARAAVMVEAGIDPDLEAAVVTTPGGPPGWACNSADPLSLSNLYRDSITSVWEHAVGGWEGLASWAGRAAGRGDSLPVRLVIGDTVLSGGNEHGVLLVEGVLWLRAGVRFTGFLAARGAIRFGAGGASVVGAVASPSVELDGAAAQEVEIVGSACAVHVALAAHAPFAPLAHRAALHLVP